MKTIAASLPFWLSCSAIPAPAQGTFQNLGFESASVPASTPPGTFVPAPLALPGWKVYIGTNEQTTVMYNGTYLDTATVALLGPGSPSGGPIQGNYSAALKNGVDPNGNVGSLVPVAIAQTGLIPSTARSLLFTSDSGLTLTIGNQAVPLFALYTVIYPSGTYEVFGGDVSPFAGQVAELRFTDPIGPPFPAYGVLIDNIVFSASTIPEPSVAVFTLLGATGLGLARFGLRERRPKRSRG